MKISFYIHEECGTVLRVAGESHGGESERVSEVDVTKEARERIAAATA